MLLRIIVIILLVGMKHNTAVTSTTIQINLGIIAFFYGKQKLLQEVGIEMAQFWGAVRMADDTELDGFDLSGTQWGYGEPNIQTCPDIWNILAVDKLFKLTKKGKHNVKKFKHYKIFSSSGSRLASMHLTSKTSMRFLPKILEKVFETFLLAFDPRDRILITLERRDMSPSIYPTMRSSVTLALPLLCKKWNF